MIRREARYRPAREVVLEIVEVRCDRCDCALSRVSGVGVWDEFPFKGSVVEGRQYPADGNSAEIRHVAAELCALCTSALVEWIGPGARVEPPGDLAERLAAETRTAMEALHG